MIPHLEGIVHRVSVVVERHRNLVLGVRFNLDTHGRLLTIIDF